MSTNLRSIPSRKGSVISDRFTKSSSELLPRTFPMNPYSALKRVSDESIRTIEIAEHHLHNIVRNAITLVVVDEEWYLSKYPDVADAINQGEAESAKDHYVMYGYFEDRLPRELIVDEEWYCSRYADVAEAIRTGKIASAQQHFETNGFKEGRLPHSDWGLL